MFKRRRPDKNFRFDVVEVPRRKTELEVVAGIDGFDKIATWLAEHYGT